ncbi:MAG: glycosyl transferase [Actinobacteria bacterium]|nr:MAG: glycosyl transferase [Actinomycetota bacterium]
MRILLMSSPVATHLMPMVPLVWAARAMGHEVVLLCRPDLVETARSAGISYVVLGQRYEELMRGRRRRSQPAHDEPPWEELAEAWRTAVGELWRPAVACARKWRPDLVLADSLEFTAPVVAGLLGVPLVQHRLGVDSWTTRGWPRVREALATLCAEAGLPEGLPEPAVVLDPCPPSLQAPAAAPAMPIRFAPFNGVAEVPGWAMSPPTRRRICVSFGYRTSAGDELRLARAIVDAVAGLPDVEAVVTISPEHRGRLGPVVERVRLVPPTPINVFVRSCDVVVHHGGSGTGLLAAATGRPQLVLPVTPWTAEHGERVAAVSAGITIGLAEPQDDPDQIRAALRRLLDDGRYAAGARELAAEMARMRPLPEVIEHLRRRYADRGVV